jgi:hypothetical protein
MLLLVPAEPHKEDWPEEGSWELFDSEGKSLVDCQHENSGLIGEGESS